MQEAKSSGDDTGRFFSHNQNPMDNNIDGCQFQSQGPYDSYHDFSQFHQTKEETPAKRTSVIHEFIRFYRPIIQEHREFQEIVSYLQDHFSPPIHPQLTIADNGMHNIPVDNITGSNNIPSKLITYAPERTVQCLLG